MNPQVVTSESRATCDVQVQIPEEVIRRYSYKRHIALDVARQIFGELESFLDNASETKLEPSLRIDEAWHEFILHTKSYAGYCQSRYGRFIHHVPASPLAFQDDSKMGGQGNTSIAEHRAGDRDRGCSADCGKSY
jgi:hypothetical protein